MAERFLTEQERVDNMTMKIENETVQGSGFIMHPPQQRRPAPPPNRQDYNMGYNRRRNNYRGYENRGRPYRPRHGPFRPRHNPYYQNQPYGPPYPNQRDMHYHGHPYSNQMRPPQGMGRMIGRGPRFGPPRNGPGWGNFQRYPSGPGRYPQGMPSNDRASDYRMAPQMQGYVPCYPGQNQQAYQPPPVGTQRHDYPRCDEQQNNVQESVPEDPPSPKKEVDVPVADAAAEVEQT